LARIKTTCRSAERHRRIEVTHMTGHTLSFAYHAIKRRNIDPVADGLWSRKQVSEHIAGFPA
jgi:hypothetical protein